MKNILAYNAEQQGKSVLFKCSDGQTLLTDDWFNAITYLLRPCDMAVVWSIDKFAEAFISLIPKANEKELREVGRTYLSNGEKIYYQTGRVFAVTYGRETNIYGLSKYADKEITDVKELEKLAYDVIKAFNYFGVEANKLTSPVSVYENVLDKITFARACDLPDESFELLEKCTPIMWQEWREVYKLGHWQANEVMDLDLIGAYPHLISRLPDLRYAKFFNSEEMLDASEYSWGLLEGKLIITQDVTPFGFIGEELRLITTDELWLINKYELGNFEMKQGWFLKLPQYLKYPFRDTMQTLYEARYNQNQLVGRIAKAISVGIGGKFAQKYDDGKLGLNLQPIYAKLITSRCAIKVADFIYRNGITKDTISVLVDGVLIENNSIKLDLGSGGMGSWRMNENSPFLITSLLYQWGGNKRPNGETYQQVMEHIKESPNSSIIARDIDLNLLEYGRIFEDRPRTGKDLLTKRYDSEPIKYIQEIQ